MIIPISRQKVKIICVEHGLFEQTPNSHLNGTGCSKCGRLRTISSNIINREEFLSRAVAIHGDRYDYSIIKYKRGGIHVDIICSKHGVFKQKPNKHMRGQGCPKCAHEMEHYNQLTTDEFINKAKKIHGEKYNYSEIDYVKSNIKVKIGCLEHGLFEQLPNNHLRGMVCIKCALKINADKRRSNTREFIKKASIVHKNKYDYSMIEYKGCFEKVKIVCPLHGIYLQTPASHLYGKGCPLCLESRGESKIAFFLDFCGIKYEREKRFKECRNIRSLSFDFYIPSLNICIEFDGRQHYEPIDYYGGIKAFEKLKMLDSIKNDYCSNNGLNLIRISYKMNDKKIENNLKNNLLF